MNLWISPRAPLFSHNGSGEAHPMTLGEAVRLGLDLEARCVSKRCGVRTPLSAVFFLNRLGAEATLEHVSARLYCTGCGEAHPQIAVCDAEDDASPHSIAL